MEIRSFPDRKRRGGNSRDARWRRASTPQPGFTTMFGRWLGSGTPARSVGSISQRSPSGLPRREQPIQPNRLCSDVEPGILSLNVT